MRGRVLLGWKETVVEGDDHGVDEGEMVFGETGTFCLFSGIYPWGVPMRLVFDGCEQ